MQGKIDELAGTDSKRHLEAALQLSGTTTDFWHINCDDQRFITCSCCAIDQGHRGRFVSTEIQLKPGMSFGSLHDLFQTGGCSGRCTRWYLEFCSKFRQHQVGPGSGQITHTHWRNSEGQGSLLPQQGNRQLAMLYIVENARLQSDCLQGFTIQRLTMTFFTRFERPARS